MNRSLLWLTALALPVLARAEVPLSAFAAFADVDEVKISPDGAYIATKFQTPDGDALAMIPLADPSKHHQILPRYGNDANIADYWWVGPKYIVVALARRYGSLERPYATGELVGIAADTGEQHYLFGFRAGGVGSGPVTGSRIRRELHPDAFSWMVDPLPGGDPDHVIIGTRDWHAFSSQKSIAYRMDVSNGQLSYGLKAPVPGLVQFLTDWQGHVRYAVGSDEHYNPQVFQHPAGDGDWNQMNTGGLKDAHFFPVKMSEDASKVYLLSDEGEDRLCAVEQDIATGKRRKLDCDDAADVRTLAFSFDRKEPIATFHWSNRPSLHLLDTANPDKDKLAKLQEAFPGQLALPISVTLDGSKAIVLVESDRNPGDYYLFETKTMEAHYLASRRKPIYPEDMAERRPISFKARDGQVVHGYLTLPPGKDARNLPLVVHPHGGPFDVADTWGWSPDSEMLASRGYAVLQVNFRGSAGYGQAFAKAGRHSWDTVMIDDITDAARWTLAQGYADPRRVCIYGASYGGYAAIMSAEREPDLYRCAVAYAGVYDLVMSMNQGDWADSERNQNYVQEYVGATTEDLRKASPINHVDKLKASLLLVHGEDDRRAPYEQAKAMRRALDERHYSYEWMTKPNEGHGFYKLENRLEFYQKLLAFLDKNIGAGAAAAPAATAAVAPPAAGVASGPK